MGRTIGLNFDPSHLILQMIDMGRFIREFGPHILHVQAKDLMIDRDGLYERGILSAGIGWQVPRIPGLGEVDWSVLFSMLYRTGYDGDIIIEHEDRVFEGTRREGQAWLPRRPRRSEALHQMTTTMAPAITLTSVIGADRLQVPSADTNGERARRTARARVRGGTRADRAHARR